MQSFIWKALIGVAFTGGLMALGAGVAHADDSTSGDDGTGSGSQAGAGLSLPITAGGNAISVLGDSSSDGSTATRVASGSTSSGDTTGDNSLIGGTQALLDGHAPVTVGGNAISVIGDSGSASSTVGSGSAPTTTGSAGSGATSGDDSTLGGTQAVGGVSVPVTLSGNAISVAGDSSSGDSFAGQSATGSGSTAPAADDAGSTAPGATTSGDNGILGGTQAAPVVTAPITVGGNAVSVIGDTSTTPGNEGSGGSVGGVETFPPTSSTAALSVQALAVTGVPALSALAIGILLLMAGIGVALRGVARRAVTSRR